MKTSCNKKRFWAWKRLRRHIAGIVKYLGKKIVYSFRNNGYGCKQADDRPTVQQQDELPREKRHLLGLLHMWLVLGVEVESMDSALACAPTPIQPATSRTSVSLLICPTSHLTPKGDSSALSSHNTASYYCVFHQSPFHHQRVRKARLRGECSCQREEMQPRPERTAEMDWRPRLKRAQVQSTPLVKERIDAVKALGWRDRLEPNRQPF